MDVDWGMPYGIPEFFDVLIHSPKESLNNTLYATERITIEDKKKMTGKITKSNLNSISTNEDPCADDGTLTRADSAINKVIQK